MNSNIILLAFKNVFFQSGTQTVKLINHLSAMNLNHLKNSSFARIRLDYETGLQALAVQRIPHH